MAKKDFEEKIREIERLRSGDRDQAIAALRKALGNRNNYLVSKAAAVTADLGASDLIPELEKAYERFFSDPKKTDPQCWAKTALAVALKDLGCRDPDVFLRGIEHVQMEPVWGGEQDSAGPLRGACLMALVDCQLDAMEILTRLGDRLTDTDPPVRGEAALAIGQLGLPAGAPLLRLKARVGDVEPGVIGNSLVALLTLEAPDCVEFVASFLNEVNPDVQIEAAAALGAAKDPAAAEALIKRYPRERSHELRNAIVASLGASTAPAAPAFLVEVIAEPDQDMALAAIESLGASRFASKYCEQARAAVATRGGSALQRAFAEQFGADE